MNLRKNCVYIMGRKIIHQLIRFFYPIIAFKLRKLHIVSIEKTIKSLIYSNKSISRFGDGEMKWLLRCDDGSSFEKNSKLLSKRLKEVLHSNDKKLEIGLPDRFRSCKPFSYRSNRYWKLILVKYGLKFMKYLNINRTYYNANITRPYINYKHKNVSYSVYIFRLLQKIWNNKNILIVEGMDSRLGVNNKLFSNAKNIKRIECPPVNAFESYDKILTNVLKFLDYNKHSRYLTLLALGPSATILAYDLSKHNYRALDVGHIDVEYEWLLMGAKDVVNIPDRYVNEAGNKNKMSSVHNLSYERQIIKIIK